MKAADVGDDVFGSCSRLSSSRWGGQEAGGRGNGNMTKECMAIKTGMLLNYADEPYA